MAKAKNDLIEGKLNHTLLQEFWIENNSKDYLIKFSICVI